MLQGKILKDSRISFALFARFFVLGLTIIGCCVLVGFAYAQTNPYDPRLVPYGSPVRQGQEVTSSEDRSDVPNSQGGVTPGSTFTPANISNFADKNVSGNKDEVSGTGEQSAKPSRREIPVEPNEFEEFVESAMGKKVKRFGLSLLTDPAVDFSVPATAVIPGDYPITIGDTVLINTIGSVEGSADFTVDRNGNIFLPQVGNVKLVGVRNRDLQDRIADAIGTQYRGFEVSVAIGKLHGIRVYVTGFAQQPGAYTVSSLSTLLNAVLAAGGPASGGSFRSIKLYRAGREISDFDLYDIIRSGDRSRDTILQNEDVIFIAPIGNQFAVVGSVNEEAIYEARSGETLADALRSAGGANGMADPSRVLLYSLKDKEGLGSREVAISDLSSVPLSGGDVIQVLSKGSLSHPLERQSVVVRIEGEVEHPGNYFLAPGSHMSTLIKKAGGLTSRAYVYGTKLTRVSVRQQQKEQYEEAVSQLETMLAMAPLKADQLISESDRNMQMAAARQVLEKIRKSEPDGRLVLDMPYTSSRFPDDVVLENNDRIVIPPRTDVVGVYGAVYRPASFAFGLTPATVRQYIDRAGGPLRAADSRDILVIRASGEVLTRNKGALGARALPGDTIFVPVKTQGSSFWARLRDISQIIFQLGLGAATVAAINR